MKTIMHTPDAYEWNGIGKYASGKADQIATILELFEKDLPPHVINWLHHTRSMARDEASVSFQNSLDLLKGEK